MTTTLDCAVLGDLFGNEEARRAFDSAVVECRFDVAQTLAYGEFENGIVSTTFADRYASEARADPLGLAERRAGVAESRHSLVPRVRTSAQRRAEAGGFVRCGAATQDVMNTRLVLQVRNALEPIRRDLRRSATADGALAIEYRDLDTLGHDAGAAAYLSSEDYARLADPTEYLGLAPAAADPAAARKAEAAPS